MKKLLGVFAVVAAGVAVAAGIGFWSEYSEMHRVPSRITLITCVYTTITFVAVAVQFKKRWRRWPFWASLGVLLAVHLVLYVVLLRSIPNVPLIGLLVISIVETQILCYALDKVGFAPYR